MKGIIPAARIDLAVSSAFLGNLLPSQDIIC